MGGAKTEMMEEMVKQGLCGRKTKAGFFLYNGKKKEVNPKAEEIIKRYQGLNFFFHQFKFFFFFCTILKKKKFFFFMSFSWNKRIFKC